MLEVVVLGHGVCRSGNATLTKGSQWLILKGDGIRHARSQLVRTTHASDATEVVNISLVVEVVEVTMLLGNAIAIVKIALLAAVAPRIVNALNIHVHLRLIAVLVPHTLSLAVGRESLLDDVAVRVVLVIRNSLAIIQLLCNLRDVVGIVGVVLCRHMVVNRAVTASHRNIYWKSEDMLRCIVRVFNGGCIVKLSVSVLAKASLVAVLVGLQLTMIAIEVVLIPCLGCNHTVCRSLILQICRIAERYECRCTVTPKVHVTLCERVLVTVGSQIVVVVTVLCLGVLVAVGILYGCGGNIALRVVVSYIVVLNSLSVNRIAFLRVKVLGDDLTETEELTFMAVTFSVLILKGSCHDWTIVMDSVVNGKGRHYPLATRKTVGRSGVGIVQCESSAQGVGDRLQHVCPANGRACNLQLAFLLRLNDVEITVTIHILQGVCRTVDAVRGGSTRVR